MSHNERGEAATGHARVSVYIRPANPNRVYLYNHLVRQWLWIRYMLQADMKRPGVDKCTHSSDYGSTFVIHGEGEDIAEIGYLRLE